MRLALAALALLWAGQSFAQQLFGQPGLQRGLEPSQAARARLPVDGERWNSYRDFWFDHGSFRIDASDAIKVADVATYLKQNPAYRVGIDGPIDMAGVDLGDRRIDSVRNALIKAGVPEYKIHLGAFGDPRLRRERRVEVLVGSRN